MLIVKHVQQFKGPSRRNSVPGARTLN